MHDFSNSFQIFFSIFFNASQFGITRAQWVVLVRLDRFEGLKQAELAEMLDLQPITLTRLLDRLCGSRRLEEVTPAEVDDALLNHVLWRAVKGPIAPEPAPRRASTLDLVSVR